jgi:hypothetical protein
LPQGLAAFAKAYAVAGSGPSAETPHFNTENAEGACGFPAVEMRKATDCGLCDLECSVEGWAIRVSIFGEVNQ